MSEQMEQEKNQSKKPRAFFRKLALLVVVLGLIALGAVFTYGYLRLARINVRLAQNVAELTHQENSNKQAISELQQSLTGVEQLTEKSRLLSAQQEQQLSEWQAAQKGDLKKWTVVEAYHLVKLANDYLLFGHDDYSALLLLGRAAQVLQAKPDPDWLDIQKALAVDIANLQSTVQIDFSALFVHLVALDTQLDQLPLPATPLQADQAQITAPLSKEATWWQRGLDYSWQALKKIVIVKNIGSDALPLVLPDEKRVLYQNLHAQMENVMWGALHQKKEIYQASLNLLIFWIEQYFIQDAPQTKMMLQQLQELRQANVQPSVVDLSKTLRLFDMVMTQSNPAKTPQ